jgi:hypothetical protein
MLELTSTPTDAEVERIPVFSIDGVMYTIPKEIPAATVLDLLEKVDNVASISAQLDILRELLGDEAYHALRECKTLTVRQLKQLIDDIGVLVMGSMEDVVKSAGN